MKPLHPARLSRRPRDPGRTSGDLVKTRIVGKMWKRIPAAVIAILVASSAFAGDGVPQTSFELAQNSGVIINSQTGKSASDGDVRPGRRERYYCVIDSEKYCRVDQKRVGAVCRCVGQTGSGTIVVQ